MAACSPPGADALGLLGSELIYAIEDPGYRGVLFIPHGRLVPIVRQTVQSACNLRPTASATKLRTPCSTPMTRSTGKADRTDPPLHHALQLHESRSMIETAVRMGVLVDIQPAWLYLDTRTLAARSSATTACDSSSP